MAEDLSLRADADVGDEVFPGLGLPVNYMPELEKDGVRGRFANAIADWAGSTLTIREITMMGVMNGLMEKPEWERKVFDDGIVAEWRAEALSTPNFSALMWRYVRVFPLVDVRGRSLDCSTEFMELVV